MIKKLTYAGLSYYLKNNMVERWECIAIDKQLTFLAVMVEGFERL
jgi:hypothetical protein